MYCAYPIQDTVLRAAEISTSPSDTVVTPVVTVVAPAGRQRAEDTRRSMAWALQAGGPELLPEGGGSASTATAKGAFRSPPRPALGMAARAGLQGWGRESPWR